MRAALDFAIHMGDLDGSGWSYESALLGRAEKEIATIALEPGCKRGRRSSFVLCVTRDGQGRRQMRASS
jgi:hypothetical protein